MRLKYFIKFIFLIYLPLSSFGQSYRNLAIAENYNIKEVRNNDEIIGEKNSIKNYYIYSYNDSKKNVVVYIKNTPDKDINFERTSYTLTQKVPNKLFFNILNESNEESRKLEISFLDKDMSISIDKSIFFLNKAYYSYLKQKLLDKKDISELVDLIDDFLKEDVFKLQDLKFFGSKEKYKNKSFEILKAGMTTVNSQNEDIINNWTISYSYNKEGVLVSVNQKSKDGIRYSKTLLNKTSNTLSYKIYWEIDERFSDDKEITFDITQNKYSDKGTYLQVGLNKETDYETIINKSIYSSSLKLELNKNEITKIFKELTK